MRLRAGELHAGGAAIFGADQVACLDCKRIEEPTDVSRELACGEAIVRRRAGRTAIAATMWLAAAPAVAVAQADYPTRTIRIVVPLPPGAFADVLPRLIGDKLAARWGHPIIIENKTGAAQNLGAELVAKAEP